VSEDIEDAEGTVYAAWLYRKPTVHDVALTGGDGPRLHHIAFATHERSHLHLCDHLGAARRSDMIERGPARHGVSNAFYLYLRDTTTSAATGGATPSSPPGTRRPRPSSTSTARRSRCASGRRPARRT
jgi:hypothetical protein